MFNKTSGENANSLAIALVKQAETEARNVSAEAAEAARVIPCSS